MGGLLFIYVTERFLADFQDLAVGGLAGAKDDTQAMLIFCVVTLHSTRSLIQYRHGHNIQPCLYASLLHQEFHHHG